MQESLARFFEDSADERMRGAASELLELLEGDEVEPLSQPGDPVMAEDHADRLEQRLEKLRRRGDKAPTGTALLEDAVSHLRAHEGIELEPWTYEDSSGVRWVVLTSTEDEEVVACYHTGAFVEADI